MSIPFTITFDNTPLQTTPSHKSSLHQDNWQNTVTGFGTSRDRLMSGAFILDNLLTTVELDALYYGSDIAAKIVDFRPQEMLRRGYEIRIDEDEEEVPDPELEALKNPKTDDPLAKTDAADPEDSKSSVPDDLMARARELGLDKKLLEGFKWGRCYGGALAILGVNDGQDASMPLDEEKVRSFDYIHVIDCRYALALDYYTDPLHPKFGLPATYQVGDPLIGAWSVVHETRCVRFEGVEVDARRRRSNAGWGLSVLQRPYESIRDFSTAFQAVGFMLTDASQGVFKIAGLIQALSGGGKAALSARMQACDESRSVMRALVLDAGSQADGTPVESFEKVATSFAGIPDILDRYESRLAAAADMPVTILMGRSPAGMNATGESDFRAFYAHVESDQTNELKPILLKIFGLIAKAEGLEAEGLDFAFAPLWSPTDEEQSKIELTIAQKDAVYMTAGVLHPSEVALSRYGSGKFSMSTEIDTESREAELKIDLKASLQPRPQPKIDPETGHPMPAPIAKDPNKAPVDEETKVPPVPAKA